MKLTGPRCGRYYIGRATRIEAHVRLCVLALQMQRSPEIRTTGLNWEFSWPHQYYETAAGRLLSGSSSLYDALKG